MLHGDRKSLPFAISQIIVPSNFHSHCPNGRATGPVSAFVRGAVGCKRAPGPYILPPRGPFAAHYNANCHGGRARAAGGRPTELSMRFMAH